MSNFTQFFSGGSAIKAIQRGTVGIGANVNTGTATITSVDTTKTVVRFLGATRDNGSPNTFEPTLQLTSATQLTATRDISSTSANVIISYELTEWI